MTDDLLKKRKKKESKKATTALSLKLPTDQAKYLELAAKVNCRHLSGQTCYMIGIAILLEQNHPDIFNELALLSKDKLIEELNQKKSEINIDKQKK